MTIPRRIAAIGAALFLSTAGLVALGAGVSAAQPPHAVQYLLENASMQVSPDTIDAGGSTTVSGTGCLSEQDIQPAVHIWISDDNEDLVASGNATPDSDGEWSTDIEVDTPGTFTVYASCDDYLGEPADYPTQPLTVNEVETTTTTTTTTSTAPTTTSTAPTTTSTAPTTATTTSPAACTPTLALVDYPGSVAQGGTVEVKVTCYRPGESLQVVLHSDPIVLTTLIADSSGNASSSVTIPLDAPIGGHTITVVGQLSGISLEASIKVVAAVETTASAPLTQAPSAPVVTSTVDLAGTGVNAAAMTVWGVVLLVAGGIAVALTRKRDSKHAGD